MVTRKGEFSKRAVVTGWPYQVALPADAGTGAQYDVVHDYCSGLSLCARGHYFRRDDIGYNDCPAQVFNICTPSSSRYLDARISHPPNELRPPPYKSVLSSRDRA